ncbi:hypothetical protein WCQ02_30915 [Paraburkholderia tropica]|uniref:hypothetical protein n=1 Tax=Paraburkholderia tropica TaxID=92647 RepID=UPI003015F337
MTSEYWSDQFHIKRVKCICDCGVETDASCQQLVKGIKKSCGCLKRESGRKTAAKMVENGKTVPVGAGSRFGKLVVLTGEWLGSGARRKVRCACDCGSERDVAIADLRGGKTTSCGCYKKEWQEHHYPLPIGQKFGKLTVLRSAGHHGRGRMVEAQCDCGKSTTANIDNIRSGHTTSCGCQKALLAISRAKHGHSRQGARSRTYQIYRDMRTRCENPKYAEFHLYGGRGITVCEQWRQGFEYFLADMGESPAGMTLERDRVNEGYSPGNCRWATPAEQAVNKRNNVFIEYQGRRMTVSQWASELGLKAGRIYYGVKQGWPPERLFAK